MIKKTLICLLAFLFVLSAAAGSFAELMLTNEAADGTRTVIYYVPATGDANELTASKSVAKAIIARWPGRSEILCARYNSINDMQRNPDDQWFKRNIAKGNDDGSSALGKKARPAGYESAPCDIWFIVPQEAEEKFMNNAQLMNECRTLLSHEQSRMHIVFIGNDPKAVPQESALGTLGVEGKADWIYIASDFLQDRLDDNRDGMLHTGRYLLAALYGRPVDLDPAQAEGATSWTFDLPEDSKVMVLFNAAGNTTISDEAGNPQPVVEIAVADAGLSGKITSSNIPAGHYTVSIDSEGAAAPRIYWYPNLDEIRPALNLKDTWTRGENELVLELGKTIGYPARYSVQFRYRDSEDETQTTMLFGEYNAEQNRWVRKVSVGVGTDHVYVTPSVRLTMADGNLAWAWDGEQTPRDVISEGVSVKSGAPSEGTVYTYVWKANEKQGQLGYKWSEIFNFNAEDLPQFDIVLPAEVSQEEVGIVLQKLEDGSGFTVTALPIENPDCKLTVQLTGKVGEEIKTHEMTFYRDDVTALPAQIQLSSDSEGSEVAVNETVSVHAVIPAELRERWEQACGQIPSWPRPESVRLSCAPYEGAAEEEAQLAGDPLEASLELVVPATVKSGATTIKAKAVVENEGDPSWEIQSKQITVNYLNAAPDYIAETKITEKVKLTGFPWAYDREESLLKAVLGTDLPFELFVDKEDNLSSVFVTVEGLQGLEMPDYGDTNGDIWTIELKETEGQVLIAATEPGTHVIRLSASDGVNTSEVKEITVKVYSEVLKYVSYAVAGLAAFLLLLFIILLIRYISKPSYDNIYVRCFSSSDEDQERAAEIMEKSDPVLMSNFKKKGVLLSTLLILFRQPVLNKEYRQVANDIIVYPAKHNGLSIRFGKGAMKTVGRHEKRETVEQGGSYRMRIGNISILIENVRQGG